MTIKDPRIQHAFENPELYNWDSLPTVPERAVMDALDGEVVYTACSQKALLDAALEQPEPVQISRYVDGYVVSRFNNTPARKPEQDTDPFEERYGEKNW